MDYGWTSLCLPAKDLAASRRFYEALGMQVVEDVPDTRLVLRNGPFRLAMMTFLSEPLLNWRGADTFAVHGAVSRALPEVPGAPFRYHADHLDHAADADGASWETRDPDGHHILFDTNELESSEEGRARRIAHVLADAERALEQAGASADCLEALRTHVIDRFTTPDTTPES